MNIEIEKEKTYYRISSRYMKERLERVGNITSTDYEILGDFVPVESLICMVEDLIIELDKVQEEYDKYKKYVEEYCVDTFNPYDEYGVSPNDF